MTWLADFLFHIAYYRSSRQRRRTRRAAARQEANKETEAEEATEIVIEFIENITKNQNGNQKGNKLKESSDSEVSATIAEQAASISEAEKISQYKPVDEIVQVTTKNRTEVNVAKEIVTIEATAIIEDSPNVTLANDELESIYRFIASKDHLIKNIADAQARHLLSREFRNHKYK